MSFDDCLNCNRKGGSFSENIKICIEQKNTDGIIKWLSEIYKQGYNDGYFDALLPSVEPDQKTMASWNLVSKKIPPIENDRQIVWVTMESEEGKRYVMEAYFSHSRNRWALKDSYLHEYASKWKFIAWMKKPQSPEPYRD